MYVKPLQINGSDLPQARDRSWYLINRKSKFRCRTAGGKRLVGCYRDCRGYSKQHRNAFCRKLFNSANVVETVDDDVANTGFDGRFDIVVCLSVTVHDDRGWICPGG